MAGGQKRKKLMNNFELKKRTRTRSGLERRLKAALPAAPFRGAREVELENLKDRLLQTVLGETTDSDLYAPLRRAANEAAALAWATWYPSLLFPSLFEEKAAAVARQASQQADIRRRSQALLDVV